MEGQNKLAANYIKTAYQEIGSLGLSNPYGLMIACQRPDAENVDNFWSMIV